MGNDALVLWLSPELALAYFIAVIVGMTGLLQIVAVRWGQERLRWLPRALALPGGTAAIAGAVLGFYGSAYRLIFVPGPAGLELILLFGIGTALAVWLTRALHVLAVRLESRTIARTAKRTLGR